MPKVGNTEFPYTKEGIAKAKAWSEMTGKPMKMKKKYQAGGQADKGRRGDTAIRPVAGKPSHVNPIEAGMIDMLGPSIGSQFAKATTDVPGSRNPRTGLPEYSWLSRRFKPSKKAKKSWNKHVKRGVVNTGLKALMGDKGARNRLLGFDKMKIGSAAIDPNLFGARQKFGSGQNIASLLDELMSGGRKFEDGGDIPAGRRMYGTAKKKKKSLQTADVGPVRGEYKKGGKVKMPKGWHV